MRQYFNISKSNYDKSLKFSLEFSVINLNQYLSFQADTFKNNKKNRKKSAYWLANIFSIFSSFFVLSNNNN